MGRVQLRRPAGADTIGPMRVLFTTIVALASVLASQADAQTLYKYRDEQGRWHFTDRKPAELKGVQTTELAPARYSFDVILEAVQEDGRIALYATNEFHAPVELRLRLVKAENLATEPSPRLTSVLPAASRTVVAEAEVGPGAGQASLQYGASYMIGDPRSEHRPERIDRIKGIPEVVKSVHLAAAGEILRGLSGSGARSVIES